MKFQMPNPRKHPLAVIGVLSVILFVYGQHLMAKEEERHPAQSRVNAVAQLAKDTRATELTYINRHEEAVALVLLGVLHYKDKSVHEARRKAKVQVIELEKYIIDTFNVSPANLFSVGIAISRDDFGERFLCNDAAIRIRRLIDSADRIGWTKKAKLWSPVLAFAYANSYDECPDRSTRDARIRIKKLEKARELYLRDGWTSRAIHRRIDERIDATRNGVGIDD